MRMSLPRGFSLALAIVLVGGAAIPINAAPVPGADPVGLSWSKGMGFAFLARSELFLSADGGKWKGAGLAAKGEPFTAVAAGGNFVLVAGESGTLHRVGSDRKVESFPPPRDPFGRVTAPIIRMAAAPAGREVLATTGQGLMVSADAGATWTPVADPFWNLPEARQVLCVGYAGDVAVVVTKRGAWRRGKKGFEPFDQGFPPGDQPVVATAERGRILVGFGREGLWESLDGKAWTGVGMPVAGVPVFLGWTGTGGYLSAAPFSPLHEGNGKGQWKEVRAGSPAFVPVASLSLPAGALVALRGKGLYLLSKGALAPVELPGELASIYARIGLGSAVVCGTQGGLFLQEGKDRAWRDVTPPDLGGAVSCLVKIDEKVALAGSMGSGPFITEDGGKTWSEFGRESLGTANTITALLVDGGRVLAGTENGVMFRSLDEGLWLASPGSPRNEVYAMALAARTVWAGTESGLYSAPSGGGDFQAVAGVGERVTSLGAEGDRIVALAAGRILGRDPAGAWEQLPGPPGPAPYAVTIAGGKIWAGTAEGLFRLDDGSWAKSPEVAFAVGGIYPEDQGVRVLPLGRGGTVRVDAARR